MEKHEDRRFDQDIRKMAKEAMDDVMRRRAAAAQEPDPETEKMLKELEGETSNPDELLLGAMEDICDLIRFNVRETENWGTTTEQMIEINRSVAELANTAMVMHGRLKTGKTLEKLRFMRGVEEKNDENIRKWSDQK